MDNELAANKKAWDLIGLKFFGVCCLPSWGPFDVCVDQDLLGDVAGKTVLEIGCGSGHSLAYLVKLGVKKAYGLDMSTTQIGIAGELNREAVENGRVQLIEAPMERHVGLTDIDIVYSIHAMGWIRDPKALFENVWSYLKPSGKLVWSWGHALYSKGTYTDGGFLIQESYFDEAPKFEEGWAGSEGVYIQPRTVASWFRYMTRAGFTVREYLEPPVMAKEGEDRSRYYSTAKASMIPSSIIFVCEK